MVSTAAAMDSHRPERVPVAMPARLPARLRSWQGEPPHMMSTGSTSAQSMAVMSPRLGGVWPAHLRELAGAGFYVACPGDPRVGV